MVEYKHDDSLEIIKLQEKILFDRPVSNLARPNIAVIAGRNAQLKEVSSFYEILLTIGFQPVLIADAKLQNLGFPADMLMYSKNNGPYINSDEIINSLLDFNTIVVITGGEVNSSLELIISHMAGQFRGTVVVDNIKLLNQDWLTSSKIVFGTTKHLLQSYDGSKLKTQGLNLKAEYLQSVSEKYHATLQAIDGQQCIVADHSRQDSVGVINCPNLISPYDLASLSVGLIAEKPSGSIANQMEFFLVAGHIFRTVLQKGGLDSLKKFLSSQF